MLCLAFLYKYIQVMQRFRVVYRGISHEKGCITIFTMPLKIQWPDGKVECDTVELHWSVGRFRVQLWRIYNSFAALWLAMTWYKSQYHLRQRPHYTREILKRSYGDDNHVISPTEFSSKTNPKRPLIAAYVFKFIRCSVGLIHMMRVQSETLAV